jgi:nitronate monooxygenase
VLLAGGIMDGRGIAAALALGAEGVQLGTAFLGCDESGAPALYRQAIAAADATTVVTRVYSGRDARVVRTRFVDEMTGSGVDVLPFPLQAAVTADVRAAALAAERADLLFLLAGQGASMLREMPAAGFVETLVRETGEAIDGLSHGR